jgi:hypothetical protein
MGQYIRHDENVNGWEYNSDGQDENHAGRGTVSYDTTRTGTDGRAIEANRTRKDKMCGES